MYEVYTVQAGDTLEKIASIYGVSEGTLREINGFRPDYEVVAGSLVVVPVKKKQPYQYYTVKKGDNMYEIAKRHGVDYHLLLQLNGLDDGDYIYPNQSIILPKDGMTIYLVQEDDTLEDILKRAQLPIEDLIRENEKIYLREGQMLVFPKK